MTTDNHGADFSLAARTGVPVLITCEDGFDREQCARSIHAHGGALAGPFVVVHVASERLLQQAFSHASGGTLFIKDITTLTNEGQECLMALLSEARDYNPASNGVVFAVRVIAGSSRHLGAERAKGTFSEDLFYRLNVIHLDLTDQGEVARQAATSHPAVP